MKKIPIDEIEDNPFNPRQFYSEESIKQLAESIKRVGLIHSITVREHNDKYEIVAGHRRFRALRMLGRKSIEVVLKELNDDEMLDIAVTENLDRKDLTNVEMSLVIDAYVNKGLSQRQIAKKLGKSQTWVNHTRSLSTLPQEIKEDVIRRVITQSYAVEFMKHQKWLETQMSKERAKSNVEMLYYIVKNKNPTKALAHLSKHYWGKPVESVRELQDFLECDKWNILYSKYLVFVASHPTSLDKEIVRIYDLKRETDLTKQIEEIRYILKIQKKWYPKQHEENIENQLEMR